MNFPFLKAPRPGSRISHRAGVSGIALALAIGLVSAFWLTSTGTAANASVEQTASSLSSSLKASSTSAAKPAPATQAQRTALHTDLKAARALKGAARVTALKKVRSDAADGKYGARIEKRYGRAADHHAAVLALLPADLQSDLAKLKAADPADRKAMRGDIRTKALAGGYGANVKKAAEILKKDWKS